MFRLCTVYYVAVLKTDNFHFMIKIVVIIDWLIYYYIDTTQRDGSYQILSLGYNKTDNVITT